MFSRRRAQRSAMARNGEQLAKAKTMIEFIEPIEVDEPQEPLPIFIGLVFGAVGNGLQFRVGGTVFLAVTLLDVLFKDCPSRSDNRFENRDGAVTALCLLCRRR